MAVNDSWWYVWQSMSVGEMYDCECLLGACMAVNDSSWHEWQRMTDGGMHGSE